MKQLDFDALPEWTYEPSGDVDGDPAYDGIIGTDHFILEGDEEIACPPDESRARLMVASPEMYRALLAVKRQFFALVTEDVWYASSQAPNLLKQVDAALDAARPKR